MDKYIVELLEKAAAPERVSLNETVRELHGRDESYHEPALPDAVVFPVSAAETAEIMKIANQHGIPVIPFGRGTSLEGHVIPYEGGISLDFSEMNKVLEVRPEDLLVRVQPGVTRTELNRELKKYGLFFSVDPGADATLGGMAATNASGTTAVKYGVMRDQVRDLEVVLADGRIIHTGNAAVKSSSGLNLNGLFVGSEGTLGSITELTLSVYGIPEFELAGRAAFSSTRHAVEAVTALIQAGIPIGRVELVDKDSIRQANLYSGTDYAEHPTLFFEFQGNQSGLSEDMNFAEEIMKEHGCLGIEFQHDTAARHQLWETRHNLAYAYIHGSRGKKLMVTDVCVPISVLAESVDYTREQLDAYQLFGGIVGHVGDGNFHALLMIDLKDFEEVSRAKAFNEAVVLYALERGGTCTGEHGVGMGKKRYQAKEHGEAVEVFRAIKRALDPNNICNPNKLY